MTRILPLARTHTWASSANNGVVSRKDGGIGVLFVVAAVLTVPMGEIPPSFAPWD